ncbi:MAG: O-methyltransferase [Bacteroidota bacterium]
MVTHLRYSILVVLLSSCLLSTLAQVKEETDLDRRVKYFLAESEDNWHNMNVPYKDGQLLYDLIIENKYTRALEIGTSTGLSGIWMAWALSKTGGKLITIEINEKRYKQALENFEEAGLSEYVDARLADAHDLVKELKGPFDFVFSDADKRWYKQYFIDLDPKIVVGGCFTAHNARNSYGGIKEFMDHIKSLENYETTIEGSSHSGVSVSYKKSRK